jgi:hypothetical protein
MVCWQRAINSKPNAWEQLGPDLDEERGAAPRSATSRARERIVPGDACRSYTSTTVIDNIKPTL